MRSPSEKGRRNEKTRFTEEQIPCALKQAEVGKERGHSTVSADDTVFLLLPPADDPCHATPHDSIPGGGVDDNLHIRVRDPALDDSDLERHRRFSSDRR
jgi:hypothetical protein